LLPTPTRTVLQLQTTGPVWIVSDLHLGDGTPSDAFFGKDRHLVAFMERVEAEGVTLVVNGDAIDFQQAMGLVRILKAHNGVLGAMSRLGQKGRLYYVIGNHDYDISVFQDILNFRVCHELIIDDRVLVRHGYEYDPYILGMLDDGQWHTTVHHLVERWLGTWLRIPLSEFYTLPNRLLFWLGHKVGVAAALANRAGRFFDEDDWGSDLLAHLDMWCWSNQGDSMGIFRPALQEATSGRWDAVICGHSHLPGVVHKNGRTYANTGSWTFASSQYVVLSEGRIRCFDWISGREYGDELYRPMLDGSLYERDFFQWWRENYLGLLRFREGEERRGRARGWQGLTEDHQPRCASIRRAPAPRPQSPRPPRVRPRASTPPGAHR
jgi:UDP-2,3-diacylglucosamine pyrophosphatase LpxH